MTEGQVLDVMRDAIYTMLICAAPMLLVSLVIGLIVSIFQTVTSIQEQTLTYIPKIVGVFLCIMIFGSFIINQITGLMSELWTNFSIYLG